MSVVRVDTKGNCLDVQPHAPVDPKQVRARRPRSLLPTRPRSLLRLSARTPTAHLVCAALYPAAHALRAAADRRFRSMLLFRLFFSELTPTFKWGFIDRLPVMKE
jgi:hypothetical protein